MVGRTRVAVLPVLLMALVACGGAPEATAPVPQSCSSSVAIAGYSDALDGREYGARRVYPVTGLSGLAVDTDGALLAVSDRSVLFTLDPVSRAPLGATRLADAAGDPLEAEGLAVGADGSRLVTSEVEPSVRRYDADGRFVGRLDVPPDLAVRATRTRSLDGVAVVAPGGPVVGAMAGPLEGDDPGIRRFPTWAGTAPGPPYAYRPDAGLDVADLAATGDGRLLVLERASTAGATVHLALADPRGVTAPAPVARTLLADLGTCPTLGAPPPLLGDVEGMTVLGRAPDGALRVLLVGDDDRRPEQTTRLYDLLVRLPPA
jgi:hypothetical protein